MAGERECLNCLSWLDPNDITEYGEHCTDCVEGHEKEDCILEDCVLCIMQGPTCWECDGKAVKVVIYQDKAHPYRYQCYQCENCSEYLLLCKGCFETTVGGWSPDFPENMETNPSLGQCNTCTALFCTACDQHGKGHRLATCQDDDECFVYCNSCPLTSPFTPRYESNLETPTVMTVVS